MKTSNQTISTSAIYRAADKITFKLGTQLNQGASVLAYLAPVSCSSCSPALRNYFSEDDSQRTEIDESTYSQEIVIYPNPVTPSETINIRFRFQNSGKAIKRVSIHSVKGDKLYETKTDKNNIQLDTHQWAKGVYIIKVIQEDTAYKQLLFIK